MKKIFLIPLLALFTCVTAWAVEVSNFAQLKAALSASGSDAVVTLANDIAYPTNGSDLLNIERSLTLDGQGHKIVGWGTCNANHNDGVTYNILTPLAINCGESNTISEVTIKNLSMSTLANTKTNTHEIGLMVFDKISELNIISCDIRSHLKGSKNNAGIAIYGETSVALPLTIENSYIDAGASGYGLAVLKPITADFQNSTIVGYSSMTLYAPAALMEVGYRTANAFGTKNSGTRGTTITATNSNFDAAASHSGVSNAYATFALEDDGIDITLTNCGIDATNFGDAKYWGIMASPRTPLSRRSQNINITYEGDNSHINGNPLGIMWAEFQELRASYKEGAYKDLCTSGTGKTFFYIYEDGYDYYAHTVLPEVEKFSATGNFNITITGGTYDFDPSAYTYNGHIDTEAADYATYLAGRETSSMEPPFVQHHITIPATHEVKMLSLDGVAVPLYRVVKRAAVNPETSTLYDLNDAVETAAEGENPVTSFELSTGGTMELDEDREVTTAGYVQVKDNEDSSEPTVVKVGTTETADPTQKVDQVLVINNGLDVQGDSKVEVQAGSALVIGEGGIVTAKPENIVIEADETGAASLLLDPTITVNQTPDLTVRMTAKQIGKKDGDYYWHRFALPVAAGITSWEKEGSLDGTTYPTYLYGWDYENNDWIKLPNGVKDMVPLQGYTLTLASEEIDPELNELQDVTYIFKGNLVGNTNQALDFQREGFNFFGNSYTGYMDVLTLIQGLESENVEGTVYMWCNDPTDEDNRYQSYEGVPLYKLQNASQRARLAEWQKEVAPMQTFILRLRGADSADETVDYASAIWGNPRYNNNTPNNAPRRVAAANNEESYMEISVKAANGKGSHVDFTQDANHNDAFESGYDVVKFMNERTINLYSTINGEDFSSVVTNTLEGKTLSLQTNGEINYTMSFKNVEGEEYAIFDNATNKVIAIEEGSTYEFAAQPNSTIEGRFEIVSRAKMPTAIENTEVKADVKGIYTIMGQYLGENFEALPAGVYVVNGVKIVK